MIYVSWSALNTKETLTSVYLVAVSIKGITKILTHQKTREIRVGTVEQGGRYLSLARLSSCVLTAAANTLSYLVKFVLLEEVLYLIHLYQSIVNDDSLLIEDTAQRIADQCGALKPGALLARPLHVVIA